MCAEQCHPEAHPNNTARSVLQVSCSSKTEEHYSCQLGYVEEPLENHILVRAVDYPGTREALDSEIAKRLDGVPRKDLVIYRQTILPMLDSPARNIAR